MAEHFRLVLGFMRRDTGKTIHSKPDGQRFGKPTTVKFNVNTLYCTTITIRPPRRLKRVNIQGLTVQVESVKEKKDVGSSVYKAEWDTHGYEVTKSNKRKDMAFILEFDHGVSMKCIIQGKFYPAREANHSHWGDPLNGIEYDCSLRDGGMSVEIRKEKTL